MTTNNKLFNSVLKINIFLLTLCCFGQQGENNSTSHEMVQQQANRIFDSLVFIRRDFHQNPELAGHEIRTSEKISQYLTDLGLEVHTNIGGNGVVGILNTKKKGKRIAWRADMDALETNVPDTGAFQSKNKGVRHLCGHDINITIALGMAKVLSGLKDKLSGTIYFVFQPSEENYKGAKAMLDDEVLKLIDPQEIYASHITPMPEGLVATRSNWLFADYKTVEVTFRKSDTTQPVVEFTKKLLSNLQNIKPDSKFWDTKNLLDPNIGLGNPNTIYKNYTTVHEKFTVEETDNHVAISSFVSSSSRKRMASILPRIKKEIEQSEFSKDLIEVKYSFQRPVITNDLMLTAEAIKSITSTYGKDKVIALHGVIPDGRGDDFAYFQEQIPGVYFLLGASNFDQGIISMPHSPDFSIDENCIKTGVKFFSSLMIERSKE